MINATTGITMANSTKTCIVSAQATDPRVTQLNGRKIQRNLDWRVSRQNPGNVSGVILVAREVENDSTKDVAAEISWERTS